MTANLDRYPQDLTDERATHLAYGEDIDRAASLLRSGVSVLIFCEKALMQYLWQRIADLAGLVPLLLVAPSDPAPVPGEPSFPRPLRQRHLDELRRVMLDMKDNNVLVLPHLDLLAGGMDETLQAETREVVEVLYGPGGGDPAEQPSSSYHRVLLGFADPSLMMPQVLTHRFGVRLDISGVGPKVTHPHNGVEQATAEALVLRREAELFQGIDPVQFYKHLAGLHPVRLRQAMRYAYQLHHQRGEACTVEDLRQTLRQFKAQASGNFELPDVSFKNIGGYRAVIAELEEALDLMLDTTASPFVRRSIPRGFILNGPPGTGKTLFAKAIAARMQGTVMIVSGPEVNGMYFGESERRVRELFADARRSAPSVIVFDEIDAIAGRRSGGQDGGARAGNAVVAQILTEMDGFREDVMMLVVGTTNRLEDIDEALLRPSRFQQIKIGYPDDEARQSIIRVWAEQCDIRNLPEELLGPLSNAMGDKWSGDDIRAVFAKVAAELHRDRRRKDPRNLLLEEVLGEVVGRMRVTKRELATAQRGRR
jgi:transitional endoplasmic reticulum ATPase